MIDGTTHAITIADPATLGDVLDLDVRNGALGSLDASTLATYAGDYRLDANTLLRITASDDGLAAQLSGAARSAFSTSIE